MSTLLITLYKCVISLCDLAIHLRSCLSTQMTCPYCYAPFKRKMNFTFHLRACHSVGEPVRCRHCGKTDFKSHGPYYSHVNKCKAK